MTANKRPLRRWLRQAWGAAWYEVRHRRLGQRFPILPRTVNLLVNDICNSRCQMCLIWQRKREDEITPAELERVLQDPLFRRVRYIGVSGGEPTLRRDLPRIFEVLARKRPALKGTGIITNAIQADTVLERVTASARVCSRSGLPFNVMVSLDGLGEVHDRIRGRAGNFESALRVIRTLRAETDIPVTFGCTITKDNLWHVDELLDFALAEGLKGRFRVAEFIQRLYNEPQGEYIRNFTPEEAYHLALFFTRLIREYEPSPRVRRTYENIRTMLLGGARQSACPYQTEAVTLDSRGQLLYCAPQSPSLGSAIETSARRLYFEYIPLRREILTRRCANCIHDYHARYPTLPQLRQSLEKMRWQRVLRVDTAPLRENLPPGDPFHPPPRSALIVGWYGTETAGDKAILGELLHRLTALGAEELTLASLHPFLSEYTVRELGYPQVRVIPAYSAALPRTAGQADLTLMGGGPLMDLRALGVVLHAFGRAKAAGKRTWIAGAGIGPLRQPRYIRAVTRLLQMADRVELRDVVSAEWAARRTGREDIRVVDDPATGFVRRFRERHPAPAGKSPVLNCYFRQWPEDYRGDVPPEDFEGTRRRFEAALGDLVRALSRQYGLRPRLLPMHHFVIGGDDRAFNRRFAARHIADLDPIVEIRPLPVEEILRSMQSAALNLTMRFHSTLFAYHLEAPFYAIDYTQGGKVRRFLQARDALDRLYSIDDLLQHRWKDAHPSR